MIKAILFDWGGVLAKSDSTVASKKLAKKYNLDPLEIQKVMREKQDKFCLGHNSEQFAKVISKIFQIPDQEIIQALCEVKSNEIFLFAKELKDKRYRLYLLSDQKEFKGEYLKNNYDLTFFDGIYFSYELGVKKPSKEFFEIFIEKSKEIPKECVFIDDNTTNIETAKRLGINVILFKNLEQLKKELKTFINN